MIGDIAISPQRSWVGCKGGIIDYTAFISTYSQPKPLIFIIMHSDGRFIGSVKINGFDWLCTATWSMAIISHLPGDRRGKGPRWTPGSPLPILVGPPSRCGVR